MTGMILSLIRTTFLVVIPSLLLLAGWGAYDYAVTHDLLKEQQKSSISYDQYTLERGSNWNKRYDFLSQSRYGQKKLTNFVAKDNILQLKSDSDVYRVLYEYDIDGGIIEEVSKLQQADDAGVYVKSYVIIKYHKFIEIVMFDKLKPTKSQPQFEYEAQICLQMPIQLSANVLYHLDYDGHIWIVTLSMNKIVFVQIYACGEQRKLVKEYRYALKDNQFINKINKIMGRYSGAVIEVTTYGLVTVDIQVWTDEQNKIEEIKRYKRDSATVHHQTKETKQWNSYTAIPKDTLSHQILRFANSLLSDLTIDYKFQIPRKPITNPIENIKEQFNTIVADKRNNYLINLSANKSQTGVLALDKYLIMSKTPLFHGNKDYNQFQVLKFLKDQSDGGDKPMFQHKYLEPTLNITKRVIYKAAYKTFPNLKTQFMGLGNKTLHFWPVHPTQEKDYVVTRTREGGLVSHKGELKGVHSETPLKYQEIMQRIDEKPQQIAGGIFDFHAKEQALLSRPSYFERYKQFGKIQLINLLNGKAILSHYLKYKQGYRYTTSYLLNNQWWILEYNHQLKTSYAKKYQLFVSSATPDAINTLQTVYGNITSSDNQAGEDDLAAVLEQFVKQHNNGYMLLSVFRCIDEYYYFEFTDASGEIFGVARIHFQRVSNRRLRNGQTPTNAFHKQVLIPSEYLAKPKYSVKPYAVAIKNMGIFKHVKHLLQKQAVLDQSWNNFCQPSGSFFKLQKLQKYVYFPQHSFVLGNHGCNFPIEESGNEIIYSFNLRNMIIEGKLGDQTLIDIRKQIVYAVMLAFPVYMVFCCCFMVCCRITKEEQQAQGKEKKESKEDETKKKEKKKTQ